MKPLFYNSLSSLKQNRITAILSDCISCNVTEERNSIFECIFIYPIVGQNFELIKKGAYIGVKCNNATDIQYFRIYRKSGNESGSVTFYCEHISYLLNGKIVLPFKIKGINLSPQKALDNIKSNILPNGIGWEFVADDDINDRSQSFKGFDMPVTVREALLSDNGLINMPMWKQGEFEFNNQKIIFHLNRGKDTDIVFYYKSNIKGLEYDESIGDVYTHIFPYLTYDNENDEKNIIYLKNHILPLPNSEKYDEIRVKAVNYGEWSGTLDGADSFLSYNAQNDIKYGKYQYDIPALEINISYADFLNSAEYINKGFNHVTVRSIHLCDYINVFYLPLKVSLKAQITRTVYDVLKESFTELRLSNPQSIAVG